MEDLYKHLCRVCLKYNVSNMVPLFSESSKDGLSCHGKAVTTFADITITSSDILPLYICQKCLYLLKQAISFKLQCEKSDEILKKISLLSNDIKEEIIQYTIFINYFPDLDTTDLSVNNNHDDIPSDNDDISKDNESCVDNDNFYEISNEKNNATDTENCDNLDDDDLLNEIAAMIKTDYKYVSNLPKKRKGIKYINKRDANSKMNFRLRRLRIKYLKMKSNKKIVKEPVNMKCDICQKSFTTQRTMKNHMQRHYGFRYICEHCAKGFTCRPELEHHQVVHHGIGKMYECKHCSFKAARRFDVIEHERIHTGERPYACDKCGLTFRRKAIWRKHLVHHSEKKFQCGQCPRRFFHSGDLKQHANNVHERVYAYRCEACGATYAKPASVRRHLTDQHGVPRDQQGRITRISVSSRVRER